MEGGYFFVRAGTGTAGPFLNLSTMTLHRLNTRLEAMKPSATLAMTAKALEKKRAGHPVIGLSAGEPDFDTPVEIADAAVAAIRAGHTHYTNNLGTPELRAAISRTLRETCGLAYAPEEIICSNGAKQSVAQAISALCGPGDEVIIPAPYWVSYPEMVRFAGAEPVIVPTGVDSEYLLDAEQLEQAITPATRMLILCSPSNPTGGVYSRRQMEALVRVLRNYPDVLVLSDEIYERIVYDAEHISVGAFEGMWDRTITVNGFSKAYAMTGWRLGYMAAPGWMVKAASKLQSQFTSAPSSISQMAGVAALEMGPEPIDRMVAAFRERRDVLYDALSSIPGMKCPLPQGAFYLFPDISTWLGARTPSGHVIESSEALCVYLLDEHDVALVPGSAFGLESGIRISYAASMDDIKEAARRLKVAFSSLETS